MTSLVPITLETSVTQIVPTAWISGPPGYVWLGLPNKWQVTLETLVQNHSDPDTRAPFAYTGLDVQVGDWLVFNEYSLAVQIKEINSQTDSTVVATVEDVNLYNLVNDPTQNAFNIGPVSVEGVFDCLIVRQGIDGVPQFANQSIYVLPQDLIVDIQSRFTLDFANGPVGSIQFNQDGQKLGGSADLTWDGTTLSSTALRGQNILIANDIIRQTLANKNLTLQPGVGTGKVIVDGDLEITGSVKGAYPQVTGILYVTPDGDDLNSGLALDDAKATIAGAAATAANQIIYRGWTYATIRVSAGTYTEPNPIIVQSGITIMGDNQRSVTVIPQNPYADIFWVNPKTYISGITFRGHLHPAAVIAFPKDGVGVISDLHDWASPYIQNCSSITQGEYAPDQVTVVAQAGTGMIVDGERGRKLSSPTEVNITLASPHGVIGPNTLVVYKDIEPTLGSQVFGPTGPTGSQTPGWFVQSGVLDSPTEILAVGSSTTGTADVWHVQLAEPVLQEVTVSAWDQVLNNNQVLVLDSTSADLDQNLSSGYTLVEPGVTDAQILLAANRAFFQAEITSYVTALFPTLLSPSQLALCTRDVGLVVDAIITDILQGDHVQAKQAGTSYWQGNTSLIQGQITQTVLALEYLQSLMLQVVQNKTIVDPYQTTVTQKTYAWLTQGSMAVTSIQVGMDLICAIIQLGADVDVFANAVELMKANQAFTLNEVLAYGQTLSMNDFPPELLEQQLKLGFEAVTADILNSNHSAIVEFAFNFYNQNASIITGYESELTQLFDYVRFLCVNVINNVEVQNPYQTTVAQLIDTSIQGGGVASTIIIKSCAIATHVVQQGITSKPTLPKVYNGLESAYVLIALNRAFIQAEVVAFVNNTYPEFVYDQSKCERDAGFIADAVAWDVFWSGKARSLQAGRAYWSGAYLSIRGEVTQTIAALNYAKSLIQDIISKTVVTSPQQLVVPQVIPVGYLGGSVASARSNACLDLIIDIISHGVQVSAPVPALGNAAQLLQLNKQFLADKVIAYVNTFPPFSYDAAKCARDVGYILDCMSVDIQTGRNSESVAAGKAYWDGATSQVPGQQTQTADAIEFLRDCAVLVVQNQPVTIGPAVATPQVTDSSLTGGIMSVDQLNLNFNLIADIIQTGASTGDVQQSALDAADLVNLNTDFIVAEALAYMNITYPGLVYDLVSFATDLRSLIMSIQMDLTVGGMAACLQVARSVWQGNQNKYESEKTQILAALDHASSVIELVVTNTPVVTFQSQLLQVFDLLKDGTAAQPQIQAAFDLVLAVVDTGANTGTLTSKGVLSANQLLLLNLEFLAAKTVAYVNATYPSLVYDASKCNRDAKLLTEAVAQDLITNTDIQSLKAASAYWRGVTSVIPGNQLAPTVAAINYLKSIALQVITNTPVVDAYTVPQTQVINVALSGGSISSPTVTSLYDLMADVINTGPTDLPIYLLGSNVVSSVTPTEWQGEAAYVVTFAKDLSGYRWGPYQFNTWSSPVVLTSPSTTRPYQGTGLSSMVMDAFTQYNEISLPGLNGGGKGIVIKNGAYAQLVSVFTICCNIAVLCESGGTCSITNSNTDFGNYGLWSDGISSLQYACTVQGAGQGPSSFLISGLPQYEDGSGKYKRPYVGQVITIGKNLPDLGYTNQQFYYIESITVTSAGSGYDPLNPPRVTIQNPSSASGGFAAQASAVLVQDSLTLEWGVGSITVVSTGNMFSAQQVVDPTFVVIDAPPNPLGTTATAQAQVYPIYYTITEASEPNVLGQCVIQIDERLPFSPDNLSRVEFYQCSNIIASSHCFEYVGSGTNIATAVPSRGGVPIQNNEVVMTAGGKVRYTSTDHLGNFRIGEELVINQNQGIITGRSFQKSLLAIMTPYMIAIEG